MRDSLRGCLARSLLAVFFALLVTSGASAISVTVNTNATQLADMVTQFGGAGINVTGATLSGHSSSSGTYTNDSGTYSTALGPGIILSTGSVSNYADGPNTSGSFTTNWGTQATSAQEALLDPISGGTRTHFDVTQLDITFDMQAGHDTVYFNVVFGSEEFPEYVGSSYVDAFGLYVNGTNIAFVDGAPVNIDHPAFVAKSGTELDGILNDRVPHEFSSVVGDGSTGNTLTIILADTSDHSYDSTVYVSQLGGSEPPPPVIPEPLTMIAVIGAVGALGHYSRKRVRA